AMPAGRRVSSKTRFRTMAGSIARPTPRSFSILRSTANTSERSERSGSIRSASSTIQATLNPEGEGLRGAWPRQSRHLRAASDLDFETLRRCRRAGALALSPLAMAGECREQCGHVFGRHRLAVIVALAVFAADRAEIGGVGLGLHAFGHHFLAELVRKSDDRAEDERGRAVEPAIPHQRAVDFDSVAREAMQIAHRAIAGAEIV